MPPTCFILPLFSSITSKNVCNGNLFFVVLKALLIENVHEKLVIVG